MVPAFTTVTANQRYRSVEAPDIGQGSGIGQGVAVGDMVLAPVSVHCAPASTVAWAKSTYFVPSPDSVPAEPAVASSSVLTCNAPIVLPPWVCPAGFQGRVQT
jgi:hypothetical protein